MGKMKNVTEADIEATLAKSEAFLDEMFDLLSRMEKGYCDPITKPIEHARNFAHIARTSAEMVSKVLLAMSMQEQKRELETLLRQRAATEDKP